MLRNTLWMVLAAVAACCLPLGCADTPQLGSDEASWTTADALWTAITAKNPALVQACAEQIERLETAGRLAPDTAAALEKMIGEAREGDWDKARKHLKAFVQGQRRTA